MLTNLTYLDTLRHGDLSKQEIADLNKKIINDPDFAEDFAFMLAVEKAGKEMGKEDREKN